MQFGFRIARIQGWLIGKTGVWVGDEMKPEDVETKETQKAEKMDERLALCCSGCPKCAEAEARRAAKAQQ